MEFNPTMKSDFLKVINKIPHLPTRVPYTYHHDYLRLNHSSYEGLSRSDVAGLHCATEDELYAVALIEICSNVSLNDIIQQGGLTIFQSDWEIIKKARELTGEYLKKERPSIS